METETVYTWYSYQKTGHKSSQSEEEHVQILIAQRQLKNQISTLIEKPENLVLTCQGLNWKFEQDVSIIDRTNAYQGLELNLTNSRTWFEYAGIIE